MPETCLSVQIAGVIFPASKHLFTVLLREVCRSRSPEVPSGIDPVIRIESAKMAGN